MRSIIILPINYNRVLTFKFYGRFRPLPSRKEDEWEDEGADTDTDIEGWGEEDILYLETDEGDEMEFEEFEKLEDFKEME